MIRDPLIFRYLSLANIHRNYANLDLSRAAYSSTSPTKASIFFKMVAYNIVSIAQWVRIRILMTDRGLPSWQLLHFPWPYRPPLFPRPMQTSKSANALAAATQNASRSLPPNVSWDATPGMRLRSQSVWSSVLSRQASSVSMIAEISSREEYTWCRYFSPQHLSAFSRDRPSYLTSRNM